MADDAVSLKGRVSAEEWQARADCAALYRLVALHGWDDMIFTHISMRVPGPEHHFLINPYGVYFEEMTASALVKVDLEGNIVDPTPFFINPAGFRRAVRDSPPHRCGRRRLGPAPGSLAANAKRAAGAAAACLS
jgi:hypothetical protein